MAESVPLVRLTKDGLWAVCSRMEWGDLFVMRVEASDAQWAKRVDTEVDRANRPRKATLDFLAGWVLREGTWEMSQRARIRLSQGRQPAFRRPPFLVSAAHDSVGFARREWDFEKKKWVRPDRDVDSPEHFSTNEESLPAFVRCLRTAPACRSSGASLRLMDGANNAYRTGCQVDSAMPLVRRRFQARRSLGRDHRFLVERYRPYLAPVQT